MIVINAAALVFILEFLLSYCEFDRIFNNIGLKMLSEEDFECLAVWKDGSELYFYGGFTGGDIVKREDMYRCFVSMVNF